MKICENCDNYFCEPSEWSPCGKFLIRRGRTGWKKMRLITRLRFWMRRLA